MAGDFNKPVVTDNYTTVLAYIRDLFADVAKGLDATGSTNVPTNAIRWNSTNKFWEKYNGASWAALESKYMINVDTLDGFHANATATAGQIPVRDGSGKVDNVNFTGVSGTLGATNGGTGISSFTLGDLIYSSASNTLTKLAGNTTTTKQYLTQTGSGSASAAPQWSTLADADVPSTLTNKTFSTGCSWSGNTIAVGQGGTGITSYTTGDLLYASGAAALAKLGSVAAGSILASNGAGAAPVWTNTPNITGITTFSAANANGKYAVHLSNASPYISMWDTGASRKWLMGSDEDQWWVYRATTQSETATDWVYKFKIDASGNISAVGGISGASLNVGGGAIQGGNITATGNIIVSNTANYIQLTDTNAGQTRYIHHNDGYVGFLTSGGGWLAAWNDAGDVMGGTPFNSWLNTWFAKANRSYSYEQVWNQVYTTSVPLVSNWGHGVFIVGVGGARYTVVTNGIYTVNLATLPHGAAYTVNADTVNYNGGAFNYDVWKLKKD